ncbi:MAG: hypothetical protein JO359_09455 [Candidatus Eremiobacteraeota bacterium]|nr:hypothetical protein [Candidatus Eremiobacteraeota bacterium]
MDALLVAISLVALDASPSPGARAPVAIVVRSDMLPADRRAAIEPIERDLARKVVVEDLKLEAVEPRVAERGEARNLESCSLNNADKIVDVDALVIPNENRQWGSQGGHYGELRLAIVDCTAQKVTKANDDTLGRPYENVDRLSPKAFTAAFENLERFVLTNLRQP